MTTFLADISQRDMQLHIAEALRVYVSAMGYPRHTEDQRAPMWLEHTYRSGWQAVAAFESASDPDDRARMVGIAYGYRGGPDQWWYQQVSQGLRALGAPRERIRELLDQYFELTELHVDPSMQGRGLGEALARRLLSGRTESHVLLSTPEIDGESNRAWRLYRRLGFADVVRQHQFAGDPRRFAVLGCALPLQNPNPRVNAGSRTVPVWHDEQR